ncbi:hypothetical protein [Sphingobium sp. CFD-2]|uniref:hypothetical protein n=1 Tax=Sphingobium sp. CFD-2 TaxID=2878542 RepID=UPI00214CBDFA|nr:hypothetical protein [Sphingobium sp. CFD-2]
MAVDGSKIYSAIAACKSAKAASRDLDAQIAMSVFPGLEVLPLIAAGVWRQDDGKHVRALRYSSSRSAAMTLVSPGCWLEAIGDDVHILGETGEWIGTHALGAIAICIAALTARLSEA